MRTKAISALLLLAQSAVVHAAPPAPGFFARRDYVGLYSQWVQVADVNGDGIPDLIGNNGGYMQVLLGDGKGTFSPGPSTLTIMGFVPAFVVTDINGDGKLDLVMAGSAGPQQPGNWGVGVSLGNGDGTFQAGVLYAAGTDTAIEHLVVGDFNSDGIPDVVTMGPSGIWLFTGKGDGTFSSAELTVSLPTAGNENLAAFDLNGDGKLDLVVPLFGTLSGFDVFFGNGDGTFQPPQNFQTPKHAGLIVLGSLTKGGPPGIAVTAEGGGVYLYFGNGHGAFSGPVLVNLPGGGVAIGDVNGDGIPDLVSYGVDIALGNGDGTFKAPVPYQVQTGPIVTNIVLADLHKPGVMDVVTNSHAAISVLLNFGNGKYLEGSWTSVDGGAGCGAAADYDGDGKPDLAVNTSAGVSIFLGTGKAVHPLTLKSTVALAGAACLLKGDLNGDGIPDLLVPVNGTPNALYSYLGNGDGTFRLKGSTAIPNSGGIVVLADLNHDGKLDFATSGNLWALGNGDGTFQTPIALLSSLPADGFQFIASGDLNNDGWPDLVLSDLFQSFSLVMLNNRHGGFTKSIVYRAFSFPAQVALADLNGDGNLDAVIAQNNGGADIYLGDGQGGLTYLEAIEDPIGVPNFARVADVNGDGIPDILLLESSTVGVFLGNGDGTFQPQLGFGAGSAPSDILTENLHGQSPLAGLPDIVVPDAIRGVLVLFNITK